MHIVNLVAKSVVKQFDEPKRVVATVNDTGLEGVNVGNEVDNNDSDADSEDDVNDDMDSDEEGEDTDPETENTDLGNPEKDWVDERLYLGQEERVTLNEVTQPVRQVLSKVSNRRRNLLHAYRTPF